jgi:hypothetical protein
MGETVYHLDISVGDIQVVDVLQCPWDAGELSELKVRCWSGLVTDIVKTMLTSFSLLAFGWFARYRPMSRLSIIL